MFTVTVPAPLIQGGSGKAAGEPTETAYVEGSIVRVT
jgi:hypothetical protein